MNLINEIKKNIKETYLLNNFPWIIGYNGSIESTGTIQVIIETLKEMKKTGTRLIRPVHIISFDTSVDNPMYVDFVDFTIKEIKEYIKEEELPILLHLIRPSFLNGFWANVIGRGFPAPNQYSKWCVDKLKVSPAYEFIEKITLRHKEVVMILGMSSKDLGYPKTNGKELVKHKKLKNTFVFAPFNDLKENDLKEYLLKNKSPWGADNEYLINLFSNLPDESIVSLNPEDSKTQICNNGSFKCWLCTVSQKDTTLTPFINKGEDWLKPLLEFRNWLHSIRDIDSYRMRKRQNGSIYFTRLELKDNKLIIPKKGTQEQITIKENVEGWVDNNQNTWKLFDSVTAEDDVRKYIVAKNIDLTSGANPFIIVKKGENEYGQLGLGPYTQKAREEILRKLLELQELIGDRHTIIREGELITIKRLWFSIGIWDDVVSQIYYDVFGKELISVTDDVTLFSPIDLRILEEITNERGIKTSTMREIFQSQKIHLGYENRTDAYKSLQKILSKEEIHVGSEGDIDEN